MGIALFILLCLILWIAFLGWLPPRMPAELKPLLIKIQKEGPEEMHPGRTGFADSGGLKIFYECFGPPEGETVLLIMGHSCSSMVWDDFFYHPLTAAGYQVIRYDHRGLGMSDWPDKNSLVSLEDMALDVIAILDANGIEKAHLVGVSMGGMIAQRLAISHKERVLSLCSIMSSGFYFDPKLRAIPSAFILRGIALYARFGLFFSEENYVRLRFGLRILLRGRASHPIDVEKVIHETLYEIRKQKGINRAAKMLHTRAIRISGSRLKELGRISVPALVVHGRLDPLIWIRHAEKYAPLIPGAEFLRIENMGHLIQAPACPEIHAAMFRCFEKARQEIAQTGSPA
jgi:proline iminopeptidase